MRESYCIPDQHAIIYSSFPWSSRRDNVNPSDDVNGNPTFWLCRNVPCCMLYEATDVLNNYVRVVLLDFSKAFDLINHHILVDKLITNGVAAHIVWWLAAFLLDRQQQVKIGNIYSRTGSPNGGVPQGTLSGPKCFFIIYK